jgi:hypothetical protein
MTDVVITRNITDIGAAIEEALAEIALEPMVAGKIVTMKQNDTWASKGHTTGITQPDTLRAALRAVKRHGPRELIVSGGAGAAETGDVFWIGGLMEVIEAEGATFVNHNRPPFVFVDPEYGPREDVRGPQRAESTRTRVRDAHRRQSIEAPRDSDACWLDIGESHESRMRFPRLSLSEAIEAFTFDAYGERLTFEYE